jgi:hypothetical protein
MNDNEFSAHTTSNPYQPLRSVYGSNTAGLFRNQFIAFDKSRLANGVVIQYDTMVFVFEVPFRRYK